MAFQTAIATEDPFLRTAAKRQLPRSLVGDCSFNCVHQHNRHKILLSKNMTQVLAFHERRRAGHDELVERPLLRAHGPYLGTEASDAPAEFDSARQSEASRKRRRLLGHAHSVTSNDSINSNDNGAALPDLECMSGDCLKVKAQMGTLDTPHRRSLRRQLVDPHKDEGAQLTLDLRNIRQKLNFKDSVDGRPRHSIGQKVIQCHCHITIWDNRTTEARGEPIARKSEVCDVISSHVDSCGTVIDINLARPFTFKSQELWVSEAGPKSTMLIPAAKYFLEIKLIPARENVPWPPISVLGKAEGDQVSDLGQLAADTLQGALVMRYLHLPKAPRSHTPLSVFFLKDGQTYRSKYGLEVRSTWTRAGADPFVKGQTNDEHFNVWAIDGENRPFEKVRPGHDYKANARHDTRTALPISIIYNLDSVGSREARAFRRATMAGLDCPICGVATFEELDHLQLHFLTSHSKYKFVPEKLSREPSAGQKVTVAIKVSPATNSKPRNSDRAGDHQGDGDWHWTAPKEPLDLGSFLGGEKSWVSEQSKKKTGTGHGSTAPVSDYLAVLRAQHDGFLPAEYVPEFRVPTRTRHAPIRLNTVAEERSIPYTSVSHRQRHVSEEPQSETDDEMDQEPFMQKSLENLDVMAEKYEWSDADRRLRSKWNKARYDEHLSHPRYLSDCLIRFVRRERAWLQAGGIALRLALASFLKDLTAFRVINSDVVRDVYCLIHDDDDISSTMAANDDHVRSENVTSHAHEQVLPSRLSRHERAENLMALPDFCCGLCNQWIPDPELQGIHCSELLCEAPAVWYHARCARCRLKDKTTWKCILCIERITILDASTITKPSSAGQFQ